MVVRDLITVAEELVLITKKAYYIERGATFERK